MDVDVVVVHEGEEGAMVPEVEEGAVVVEGEEEVVVFEVEGEAVVVEEEEGAVMVEVEEGATVVEVEGEGVEDSKAIASNGLLICIMSFDMDLVMGRRHWNETSLS